MRVWPWVQCRLPTLPHNEEGEATAWLDHGLPLWYLLCAVESGSAQQVAWPPGDPVVLGRSREWGASSGQAGCVVGPPDLPTALSVSISPARPFACGHMLVKVGTGWEPCCVYQ